MKPNLPQEKAKKDLDNLKSALIILADRERYAGIQVEWAERFMEEHARGKAMAAGSTLFDLADGAGGEK